MQYRRNTATGESNYLRVVVQKRFMFEKHCNQLVEKVKSACTISKSEQWLELCKF